MPEILSQAQIDELLNGLTSGELDYGEETQKPNERKVKDYDFRSPKKLTKEQMKTLFGIFENFSRHLASYFSGITRSFCEISVSSIEEQPYFEYNNALPDSILISVLDAKPIEGAVLMDFSNQVTFALIERLLGGTGESLTLDREFTDIEVSLMTGIFRKITEFMQESWSHYLHLDATLKQMETNSRLMQSMPMDETVVIIVMDATIRSVKGSISCCIPCINLEGILDQVTKDQFSSKRKLDKETDSLIEQTVLTKLKESPIEVIGLFGETVLTLRDVVNLQIGDVIRLDQRVDSSVKVLVDNKVWFYGIPGIKKNKKVIKINTVL